VFVPIRAWPLGMNVRFFAPPDQFEGCLVRLAATRQRIPWTEGLGHEELRQKHLGPETPAMPGKPANRTAVNGPKCSDDNLFGLSASSNTLHGTRIMIMIAAVRTPLALECLQAERGCSVAETRLVPRGPAGETWSEWSGLPGPPVWTYGLLES